MRKKVLISAHDFSPPINESWVQAVEHRARLLDADIIGTSAFPGLSYREGRVRSFNNCRLVRYLLFIPYLLIVQKRYDFIVFENLMPKTFFSFLLCRMVGIGLVPAGKVVCVLREQGKKISGHERWIDYCLRNVFPRLKGIVACDEDEKEQLLDMNPGLQNITVVPPGIDTDRFADDSCSVEKGKTFVFLFASSPMGYNDYEGKFRNKGLFVLIEAFKRFVQEHDARLHLFWRGSYVDEIIALVARHGLEDNVEITDDVAEMTACYKNSHVTIFPAEGMTMSPHYPRSIMESIACGRPVIVSNIVRLSQIVEAEGCGVSMAPTVDALFNAMKNVYMDYEKMQAVCRTVAEKHFDYRRNIEPLINLLD